MRKLITAAIGLLFLLFYCTGCISIQDKATRKANRHLRKAEKHIRKAEELGLKWHRDTIWKDLKFKVPGIDVKFVPKILTVDKPMYFIKDSVITKVVIKKGVNGRDTVYVDTKCPDREVTARAPVAINNEIKAGRSFWFYAGWGVVIAVVFFAVGYFTRDGPPRWLNIRFDNNEKPPS